MGDARMSGRDTSFSGVSVGEMDSALRAVEGVRDSDLFSDREQWQAVGVVFICDMRTPTIGSLPVVGQDGDATRWSALAPGPSGRYLRTNGPGQLPTWEVMP